MKRLCVFYSKADEWLGRKVDWIICKECQRKLQRGVNLQVGWGLFRESNGDGCKPRKKR